MFNLSILLYPGVFRRILVKLLTFSKLLHVFFGCSSFSFGLWKVLSSTEPGILNHIDLTLCYNVHCSAIVWHRETMPVYSMFPCKRLQSCHEYLIDTLLYDHSCRYTKLHGNCFIGFTTTEFCWKLNPYLNIS